MCCEMTNGMGKYLALICLVFFSGSIINAQPAQPLSYIPDTSIHNSNFNFQEANSLSLFTVRNIDIVGNKRTKRSVILRELPFKDGDQLQLSELVKKFEEARRQLMNTVLFHEVIVALKSFDGYYVDILVQVRERWYLFPVPYFKFVDRNINQWLVEQHANLNRVNYGIKLLYNNATGHNDKLNLWLMNGYTKQISLNYDRPYLDKNMKWGMSTGIAVGKNREVNYITVNNKQVFFKDTNSYVRSFFRTYGEVTYRKAIKTRHRFGIALNQEKVRDTIAALNPAYFKNGRDKIVFPEVYYHMNYFNVDYIPYPLKGYMAEIYFAKKGFNNNLNLWQLNAKASGSWEVANKTYFGTVVSGILKLPFYQPYFNQRLLGYNDFYMQGYEYYVVDGVAGGYVKTTLSREILNLNFQVRRKKEKDPYRIPFRVYAKTYTNAGYMYNPTPGINTLNNRMLYSWGFGLDIITHYDFTIKLEWSFNHLGQNDIFLHRKTYF